MNLNNLPGPLKVAILIKAMGGNASQKVLRNLNDREREIIRKHMSQLGEIPVELVENVAKDFSELAEKRKIHQLEEKAGSGKKKREKDDLIARSSNIPLLGSLEPDELFKMIKDEYPQTIAVVLAHLAPSAASHVLSKLPEDLKTNVAIRIAKLEKVAAGMLEEIDLTFSDILKKNASSKTEAAGGVGHLAEILNHIGPDSSDLILNEMEEIDPDLAAQTRQRMFVFEDLVLVDDKGLQKILRNVETRDLAIALKGATDAVKEKIFRNMSERAGEMVAEEIEAIGSVRMKDVENSQMMITKIIQDLHQRNEIIIAGHGGEELIE